MSLKSAHTGKVGKAFKNARILRSMTVEEVAHQTLISIGYIKAIESGDYAVFPSRIFAVQYFKKYAKFLNLEINFFDIYNAEVVAAAEKEIDAGLPKKSFSQKNILTIACICIIFLISLVFIFQSNNNIVKDVELRLKQSSSNAEDLQIDINSTIDNDISVLHNEINNFFMQDKLDSIQLDVTVDSLEPEA